MVDGEGVDEANVEEADEDDGDLQQKCPLEVISVLTFPHPIGTRSCCGMRGQGIEKAHHLQPIPSVTHPPQLPTPNPTANTRFRHPCHIPLFLNGIISHSTILANVLKPPAKPVIALATIN